MNNLSICFTNYNRTGLLYEAVEPFLNDTRIKEIVISDDNSDHDTITAIWHHYQFASKVRVHRNEVNLDCYHNKAKAIERATGEWVCILDSDNIFSKEYIDRMENLFVAGLNPKQIYQPEFARPHFDFRHVSGKCITRQNVAELIDNSGTQTMLNAMNYLVNRQEYLRVFDNDIRPVTSDSIYQNYRWIEAGNMIYVVPDFQYDHRVHDGSHYRQNVRRTPSHLHDDIVNRLKQMK